MYSIINSISQIVFDPLPLQQGLRQIVARDDIRLDACL